MKRVNEVISSKGKFVVFICILLNLLNGIQNCWSVLGKGMIAEYGWTTAQATLPYSVLTAVSGTWALFVTRIAERSKPRYTIIFGGCMLGGGLILSSLHKNPGLMVITAGLMLGMSSASTTASTGMCVVGSVPFSRKGLCLGLTTAGMALSAAYMSPVINGLTGAVGVHMTMRIMGAIAICAIPILACILPMPQKKPVEKTEGKSLEAEEIEEDNSMFKNTVNANQALKKKELWVCWFTFFALGFCGLTMTSQTVMVANTQVPEWESAYLLVTIMAVANMCGRLFWSSMADKFGGSNCYRLMFLIQCVNMLLFPMYNSVPSIIAGACVLGACFGGGVPLIWSLVGLVFGKKYTGSIYGICATGWALSGILGPMMAATLKDATGSYVYAYYVIAAVLVLGIIALSVFIKDKKLSELFAKSKQAV